MNAREVIRELEAMADPRAAAGMRRFAIGGRLPLLGVSIARLRPLARRLGRDHVLALELWNAGYHEARILAALIDDPQQVTVRQMDAWAREFDSWDLCDGVCLHLFRRTPFAWGKVSAWTGRRAEFVRRAGFVLLAVLAVHDKLATNEQFERWLPTIVRGAGDERHFVKKAVNWALRQIGKRNGNLRPLASRTAEAILALDTPAARWIALDALREFTNHRPRARGSAT